MSASFWTAAALRRFSARPKAPEDWRTPKRSRAVCPSRSKLSRHDKLVVLVDKLLGLMPKLRLATADSEKAVLQNAVTATNQQIDKLVYDLYGLTEAEKNLVEGNV